MMNRHKFKIAKPSQFILKMTYKYQQSKQKKKKIKKTSAAKTTSKDTYESEERRKAS